MVSVALTSPVWLWGWRHEWANITFQVAGRHGEAGIGVNHLATLFAGAMLLATPFFAVALVIAGIRAVRRPEPGWRVLVFSAASPVVFFSVVALSVATLATSTVALPTAAVKAADKPVQIAACNPCNPCAAKKCNPCAAAKCNPCNPCAAAKCNPCNPCAAAKCNPCNPCKAQ